MASVHLTFEPPDAQDIVALRIFEGPNKLATFSEIERLTTVGAYPTYLTEYTTNQASSSSDWFAIQWEDSKGALSDLSVPVQGSTSTPVGIIAERVTLRDSSLNDIVVVQEAEAALEMFLPAGSDVYDATVELSYRQQRGLTNLTLAMCYLTEMAHTKAVSWVAGIVSLKSSDVALQQRADSIKGLLQAANLDLGTTYGLVAHLEDVEIAGGASRPQTVDQTRLLVELH
jgi:hypothetical protein